MKDHIALWLNLIRVLVPMIKDLERILNDTSISPRSRLFAVRSYIFELDEQYRELIVEFYETDIYTLPLFRKTDASSDVHFLSRFNMEVELFLN